MLERIVGIVGVAGLRGLRPHTSFGASTAPAGSGRRSNQARSRVLSTRVALESPTRSAARASAPVRQPRPLTRILEGVWGTASDDVWAAGQNGILLHWDGTSWSRVTVTSNWLKGITGDEFGDVWVVGENGTVLHYR